MTRRLTVGLRRCLIAVMLLGTATACGPKPFVLPSGPGQPIDDFRTPFDQASAACRGVRTVRTSIGLSGRAGNERMRGTLIAGLAEPDSLRLEGVAPFGPPVFILVSRSGSATLLLPRDNRVLTGVTAADILEALAGLRLDPVALRAILSGCVTPDPQPVGGHAFYTNGPIRVGSGSTGYPRKALIDIGLDIARDSPLKRVAHAYLRQIDGQWRIVAGVLPGLQVEYDQFESGLPKTVRIASRAEAAMDARPFVSVSLLLALSDVATNVTLNPAAFAVDVPPDAVPMTLSELRDAGPLGVKGSGQ